MGTRRRKLHVTAQKLIWIFILAALGPARVMCAQVASPNEAGVAMGQIQLLVQDVPAELKFWTTLGGTPAKLGTFDYVKFPGVLIFFRKGNPSAGSVGSVVNHIGFYVMNIQDSLAKWNAAGLKTEPGQRPGQAYVMTADNLVRIEILENTSLKVPISFDHIHFWVTSDKTTANGSAPLQELQAWYAKVFSAKATKRGPFDAAILPGVALLFAAAETPTSPTKGRGLDRIGFEIKDLEAFCKRAESSGVKFEVPFRKGTTGLGVAALTDPAGTYIELNEGLSVL
jgi:catechol 2,3-dioxygenase-like lactoylglutathione lyase family enzyme